MQSRACAKPVGVPYLRNSDRMQRPVKLFVSATPDLEPERDVVGRVIAKLPISIGWQIGRSPRRGEPLQPALEAMAALEAVAACDIFLFLLGQDITAPAGVEWDVARRADRHTIPLLKEVLLTPAAQSFVRQAGVAWTPFASHDDLIQVTRSAVVEHLLARALQYGLGIVEHEALLALDNEGGRDPGKPAQVPLANLGASLYPGVDEGGAGAGAVILGPHSLPHGGVALADDG